MKIGFLGAGNMAGAIIKGIYTQPEWQIAVYDKNPAQYPKLTAYGVSEAASPEALVQGADVLVLAVKPNMLEVVLPPLAPALMMQQPLMISIAAGKSLDFLQSLLPYKPAMVRVMPNLNAMVGESMSAYCATEQVTETQKKTVEQLFACVGKILPLPEKDFPLFGILGGAAPAFCFLFMEALARAGVRQGMPKDLALQIVEQVLLGSAKALMESGEHPWSMIDRVCSPGGTTIEGIASLLDSGFESALHKAVEAGVNKDRKL